MSNIAISELTNSASNITDNDLFLLSKINSDGTTYTSSKGKFSLLKSYLDSYIKQKAAQLFSINATTRISEIVNNTSLKDISDTTSGSDTPYFTSDIYTIQYTGLLRFTVDTSPGSQVTVLDTDNVTRFVSEKHFYNTVILKRYSQDKSTSVTIASIDNDTGGILNNLFVPVSAGTNIGYIIGNHANQYVNFKSISLTLFYNT